MDSRPLGPLPQRAKELVDSIRSTLDTVESETTPETRAAAVAKIRAESAELVRLADEARRTERKVPEWVKWVSTELMRAAFKGILDVLLRIVPRFPRLQITLGVVWP